MYKVEKFEVHDPQILFSVMDRHPFATVTSITDEKPFVSHLPITTELLPNSQLRLLGHMSKRNPQWRHFECGSNVVIAFQGPHTYINPNWYTENDVPTWNYVVVHAQGKARVVQDYSGLIEILQKSTDHMNRTHSDQWDFWLPEDLESESDLTSAIVGFELVTSEVLGKFKLSQNRSSIDQERVVEALKLRSDESSQSVANWMAQLKK